MNLNKGCIEILDFSYNLLLKQKMNLNKGCIEIYLLTIFHNLYHQDEP